MEDLDKLKKMAEEKLKELSKLYMKTTKIKQKERNGRHTTDFVEHLVAVMYSTFDFDEFPTIIRNDAETRAGRSIVQSGTIPIICEVIEEAFESKNAPADLALSLESEDDALRPAVTIVWNFTFSSADVATAVLDEGRLVPILLTVLEKLAEDSVDWTRDFEDNHAFVCIINNISMHDGNDQRLQKLGAFEVLLPYLKSENEEIRLSALSAVANIATEEQANRLATTSDSVWFLLYVLEGTLRGTHSYGWTVAKIVRAVRQLARNDANKRLLAKEGALPLLVEAAKEGAKSGNEEEQKECLDALWMLSLDNQNVQAFLNNDLLDLVASVSRSESVSAACRHAAQGILWQLRYELEKMPKYRWWNLAKQFMKKLTKKGQGNTDHETSRDSDKNDGGHVMVSYQWDDQTVVKELCGKLREQKFKVWMDVDNMEGSLPQAMAEAVENAFVVLTCMSQKYKDSQACRQEAHYAFDKKKEIIPLLMQEGFTADGWLGLIVAGKLYYDFSKDRPFDRVIWAVQKVLAGEKPDTDTKGASAAATPVQVVHVQAFPPKPQLAIDADKIKAWTQSDVQRFLAKAGLDGPKVERFTGSLLVRLYRMYKKDEDEFFTYVETNLKLDAFESDSLGQALDKLPSH